MEVIIGVFGLLMMAGGVMEGFAGMAPTSAISGAVMFSGGMITLALGGLTGQVRRLRHDVQSAGGNK